jgi:FAD binding domain/Berberine and berberine like
MKKIKSSNAHSVSTAASELRALMQGEVLLPGDDDYLNARQIWNGAVEHRPAMFAQCKTVKDVQTAVRAARTHGLPLSVRGGGHDWAGRALCHEGLVIDLSMMREVTVDATVNVATMAGGATAADVSAAISRHGLAAVTGNVGAVGMAGLLLGGGYGPLTTRFGLALDNLLGAEVVLADGRLVIADTSQNSDLFWALRGGGGNFGVVTSMRIRVHPVGKLLAGMILFPWSDAESVLRGYAEIMSSAPDELSVLAGLLPGPDGGPVVFIGPIWSGEPGQGREFMARLMSIGKPIISEIGPMSYAELMGLYDAQVVNGRHYALQTRWLADLIPEVISAVVRGGTARTSPLSFIVLLHFHGAGTRVAPDATAFGLRRKHFLMEIVAAWDPTSNENGAIHRQWLSDVSSHLAPLALRGGYPNFLTEDDSEQLGSAYGNNASRLRDLKRRYDPDNVFSSTIPLPF